MRKRIMKWISALLIMSMFVSLLSPMTALADELPEYEQPTFLQEGHIEGIVEKNMDEMIDKIYEVGPENISDPYLEFLWNRFQFNLLIDLAVDKIDQDTMDLMGATREEIHQVEESSEFAPMLEAYYKRLALSALDSTTVASLSPLIDYTNGTSSNHSPTFNYENVDDIAQTLNKMCLASKNSRSTEETTLSADDPGYDNINQLSDDGVINLQNPESSFKYLSENIYIPIIHMEHGLAKSNNINVVMLPSVSWDDLRTKAANVLNVAFFEVFIPVADTIMDTSIGDFVGVDNFLKDLSGMVSTYGKDKNAFFKELGKYTRNTIAGIARDVALAAWAGESAVGAAAGVASFWANYYATTLLLITYQLVDLIPKIQERNKMIQEAHDMLDDILDTNHDEDMNGDASTEDDVRNNFQDATSVSPPSDPLVLDLNGDGFNILNTQNGTYFDLDCNGFREKTEWIKDDDAFLALDLNGDGKINNGRELFGDYTLLEDDSQAPNGFAALAQYDNNADSIIDENDDIFKTLLLWRDDNSNGISEEVELFSLSDFGITKIHVSFETVNQRYNDEILIGNLSSFELDNGAVHNIAEYWFSVINMDTNDSNIPAEIPPQIAVLPNVRSYGKVLSLHKAIALDSTGKIRSLLIQYMNSTNLTIRRELISEILFELTGAQDIEEGSRGSNFSAKKLHVIEQILGTAFIGQSGPNPNVNAAILLEKCYNSIINLYDSIISKQTILSSLIAMLEFDENYNFANMEEFMDFFYEIYENSSASKSILLSSFGSYLYNIQRENPNSTIFDDFITAISNRYPNQPYIISMLNLKVGSDFNLIMGTNGNDRLTALSGNNTFIGGSGNDSLTGGSGDDSYFFDIDFGNDIILEKDGNDMIVFGEGITRDMIQGRKSIHSLVISIRDSNDTITIANHFLSDSYHMETIQFADGSEITTEELLRTLTGTNDNDTIIAAIPDSTVIGLDGDDILQTLSGNNIFIGGLGNDRLNGANGNDSYFFDINFGNDIILEKDGNDMIVFGEGITRDMIQGRKSIHSLVISIRDSNDTITIANHFLSDSYHMETIRFADGSEITTEELLRTLTGTNDNDTIIAAIPDSTVIGLDGDDTLQTLSGNNTFIGGLGNDRLNGANGNDSYFFDINFGNDTILEKDGNDIIVFGEGITRDMIQGRKSIHSLVISIRDSNDTITIANHFLSDSYHMETIRFADGSEITTEELLRTLTGTNDNDTIIAAIPDSTVIGLDGDDTLQAHFGNITFIGDAGNDTITAHSGNNTFIGGLGNDRLNGANGNDSYFFDINFGNDTILEKDGNDIIVFGEGITRDMIQGRKSIHSLVISIRDSNDTITIANHFLSDSYHMETIRFADGSEITTEELLRTLTGTNDNDTIIAAIPDSTVIGLDGDDTLQAHFGNITFIGDAGNDTITAHSGNNTFIGGLGNDRLNGANGNDSYFFDIDFGNDTILEKDGNDMIVFGEGITKDMIQGRKSIHSLVISIRGSNDTITITNHFLSDSYHIETIRFADGSEITVEELLNPPFNEISRTSLEVPDSTQSDDTPITDETKENTVNEFYGTPDNDTYTFDIDADENIIYEEGGHDTITFSELISEEMIYTEKVNEDLIILIKDSNTKITIFSYFASNYSSTISIQLFDETELLMEDLIIQTLDEIE
jgi:Ca2+-binding RTX toxin-like protein